MIHRLRAERVAVLPTPGWALVLGDNDTTLHDLHFYVWIVSDGTSVGLVDAGLPRDPRDVAALGATNAAFGDPVGFREVRALPEVLDDLGIDPEAVSFVAITQTVSYHTGGIDAGLLPNATFYLARDGVLELLVDPPGHPAPEFYFTAAAWAGLRTLAIEGRLRLVAEAAEIAPGVDFEVTGGHHPGSAAVLVQTSAGLVALLETAFVRRNLETGSPIGIAEDAAAARRAMRRMSARADIVVALHDAGNAEDFREEIL